MSKAKCSVKYLVCFLVCYGCAFLIIYETMRSLLPEGRKYLGYMESGAILSTISCLIVMISYLRRRRNRRHPNPLLFWKTMTDMVFCCRFLFAVDFYITREACQSLAAFSTFLALSSECWFLCIPFDLWYGSANPFANIQQHMKAYHFFSWGLPTISAIALLSLDVNFHPNSGGDFCWFNNAQTLVAWLLYYGVVVVFIVCGVIFLLLENRLHPFGGMKEVLKTRSDVISSARLFTVVYTIYQGVLVSLWLADAYFTGAQQKSHPNLAHPESEEERTKYILLRNLSSLLHGSKGLVDLVIWVIINGVPLEYLGRSSFDEASEKNTNVDIDLEPQLNIVLRREVLHFTTRGIVAAASQSMKMKDHRHVIKLRIHEMGMTTRFNDYEPLSFRSIRLGFGLDEEKYKHSFTATCHERMASGGSSGAFMFYTSDYLFLVKSITREERAVLLRMLPNYISHMQQNPESHLTRYYGCHSIHMYGKSFSFVVMGNVMGKLSMHQFYDIKGSWIDRNADPVPPGKTMICTYCSQAFTSGSSDTCEYSMVDKHMPHIVLKDNDFRNKIRIKSHAAHCLTAQIESDCEFLRGLGIMDYSLLLSVHNTKYVVDTDSIVIEPAPTKRRVNRATCRLASTSLSGASGGSSDKLKDLKNKEASVSMTTEEVGEEVEFFEQQHLLPKPLSSFPSRNCRFSVVNIENDNEDDYQMDGKGLSAAPNSMSPLLLNSRAASYTERRKQRNPVDILDPRQWAGERSLDKQGLKASVVVGPDYYTMGIVDMLQTWTWRKKLESFWKIYFLRSDRNGISAIPPTPYASRFKSRIQDLIVVDDDLAENNCFYNH